jgi:hypothetical protein
MGNGYRFVGGVFLDDDGMPNWDDPSLRVLVASVDFTVGQGESLVGLCDDDQVVHAMVLLTPQGVYRRDQGYWVPMDPDNDTDDADIDQYDAYDTDSNVVPLWDSAQASDGTMTLSDLLAS